MPRYSKDQKVYITNQLKKEVRDCLKLYGVRKTSMDELVARVNIPKTTFYLYFPSKEELQYQVICEYKNEMHKKFYDLLCAETHLTCESFTKITFEIYKEVSDSFLVQVAKNNELDYLFRKLPENIITESENQLNAISENLLKYLPIKDKQQLKELLASFKLLFYTSLHKEEIGEQLYYGSLWMLLSGISKEIGNVK